MAGSLPWSIVVGLNLKYGALFPWASVVMVAYLVGLVKYLDGWGPPHSSSANRRRLLRANGLSRPAWRWALIAGGAANAALVGVFIVVSRFGWIHRTKGTVPAVPVWTLAAWLLTSAAVAGIAEECGFRGYMQKILEDRYRAPTAIAITSVIFGAFHLSHGLSIAILFDAAWGAVYGVLAYFTGSILPSRVLHASLDALEFFLVWRFAAVATSPLVRLDRAAGCALAMAAALSAVALWAFRRLGNLRPGV
jgi:membrane protease YdiL (CAAX protease family)